ncbi:MAG: mechanosensitive ion channel [Bacteroides sp.]|nr:mechanosensitive ion channel [Bacteroidales bacterium]MBD5302250.1 mechanosensitive ion channel [Bacteroides sp.]MBD5348589.1 mechanosensitive ion channel [Bacteroides sp.]
MIDIQSGDVPVIEMPEVPNADSWLKDLKGMGFDELIASLSNSLVSFSLRLLAAILVFYIGRFLIRRIFKTIFGVLTRRKVDASLTTFVLSLVKISLYFFLIIIVIGILGIETSSFIAIFASAGMAIGMALSGTLQNFAGGVLILLLKPYKVGDFIEVQGFTGTVKSIQLFNTVINTVDNKAIIVPNGSLSTSSINNYSLENYRRVDWNVSLAYGTDLEAAKAALLKIVTDDARTVKKFIEDDIVLREQEAEKSHKHAENEVGEVKKRNFFSRLFRRKSKPVIHESYSADLGMPVAIPTKIERPPFVGLSEMADSAIILTVRAWTHSSNYWGVYFDINERIYKELPELGFSFPFPQLDVHLDKPATS